jgi:glycosyltransferase involved in cell wall biosynthesis
MAWSVPAAAGGFDLSRELAMRCLLLRWGSLERSPHVVTLANFLCREGCGVLVATMESGYRPANLSERVVLRTFGRGPATGIAKLFAPVRLAGEIRSLLRSQCPDVLWVIDSWTLPPVLLAMGGRPRRRGGVFVYHTFDWLDPMLNSPVHMWYEGYALRRADLAINVDRSRARLHQTIYGLKDLPLWIPNYPSASPGAVASDGDLRRVLGGSDESVLVICPSLAAPQRLHLQLIEAFALLPARYRLLTFGAESEYFDTCCDHVRSEGLEGRVRWLPSMPYQELERYLAVADIGVILHDWQRSSGYWMANADRMAHCLRFGMPVVASNVPNMEALIYKWGLGACCDPYDPSDIARAIREVEEQPPGVDERRCNVQRAFKAELNFERRGRILMERLEHLCSQGSVAGRELNPIRGGFP